MKNEINESVYDINMDKLCQNSIELIKYARNITAKQVNNVQIMTYYSLGRWIVEVQQQGKHRAEYGKKIIINLSKKLTEEFGKGFSESKLEKARKFYLTYKDRISETLFTEFAAVSFGIGKRIYFCGKTEKIFIRRRSFQSGSCFL